MLQSLRVKIKVQGCLPESLADTQIIFSLCGKAYPLTTALADCPAPGMDSQETAESAELPWTFSEVKRGQPRFQDVFKAGEKMETKHWSSGPLCLTHALPQVDHGHGPAEVPRGTAFP